MNGNFNSLILIFRKSFCLTPLKKKFGNEFFSSSLNFILFLKISICTGRIDEPKFFSIQLIEFSELEHPQLELFSEYPELLRDIK